MFGGVDEYEMDLRDSTETYDHISGRWVMTRAKLPIALTGLRAINIYNSVLIFGMIYKSL